MMFNALFANCYLPWLILSLLCSSQFLRAQPNSPAATSAELEKKFTDICNQLPSPRRHLEGTTEAQVSARIQRDHNYQQVQREKLQEKWFAALLSENETEPLAIHGRFATWKGLLDFLQERNALVEVWAYPEGPLATARRIPATEMAELKKQRREQPTFITATWRDEATGELHKYRLEFGFQAAETVLAANRGYQRHREIQSAAREVLSARDALGQLSAKAQWKAITAAAKEARLSLAEIPEEPTNESNLFVAFEFVVDGQNNFTKAVRIYRESEIERKIAKDTNGNYRQILILKKMGEKQAREASGFRVRGVSDELEEMPNPVLGQDFVELRVQNPAQPDPRQWNVLEFGEPELIKQSALAKFSLINAYLEKRRKEIAVKKSRIDLIAEPIFAGLNIGGGLSGIPFPMGEAARLAYNAAVVPWFIPAVPSVKEMRELFRLMAAKDKDPELKTKPDPFLNEADFKHLQARAKTLTDVEVAEFLQRTDDRDLKGMLRLAKLQRIDAKVSNLLSILADAGKVSGWTDGVGFQRDVFNSIFFSVTGDVSIKNIIAALVGGSVATPNAGYSLEALSKGQGPQEAWLQYLNFTVDIRAVVNTVARLSHRDLADKELKKPFPYAARMTDLAAYEIRIFGFPLLIFYKRGMLKDDVAAYQNDYAYGLLGTKIVEHFSTQRELEAEIRAGRMMPLGYVRVLDGKGSWKETNLAVFAHRIPSGKHKGKTAIILYGLKAFQEHSQSIEREYLRFKDFEKALREGAVIEQLVDAENRWQIPAEKFEPKLQIGPQFAAETYAPLLGGLLELRRFWQRKAWGLPLNTNDADRVATILEQFAARGIWLEDGDALVGVDRFSSSFLFRKRVDGKWRMARLTLIPSLADLERDLAKAEEGARIEQTRREAISNQGEGVVLLNMAKLVNGRFEIGPLVTNKNGEVSGAGLRSGAKAIEEVLEKVNELPVIDQARLQLNNFASTVIEFDADGDGQVEKVFLTIEFPLDKKIQRERTNPLSGEREVLTFENGRWLSAVTDQRVAELDYDQDKQETRSRVYFNAGTRQQPVKGALLEETRTLDFWCRDLNPAKLDPYLPALSKIKVNYVTGQLSRETYGLFPQPVSVVSEQFVTENRFNPFGVFASAKMLDNGNVEADFQRPVLAKLLKPMKGVERFTLTATATNLAELRSLKALGYKTAVERRDLAKGLAKTFIFDNARFGREASESFQDSFDGSISIAVTTTPEYRDDFFFGVLPFKTTIKNSATSALLSKIETKSYDALSRRLTGLETDHTGKSARKVWDYRWENPMEVETTLRRTANEFNRAETSFTGHTVAKSSGEPLGTFSGQFDTATKRWQVNRTRWYRAGITNRAETETLSGFGKLISTRTGDAFEAKPIYNADGIEQSTRIFWKNAASGQFDLLQRVEEDYQWKEGRRNARIQTFVEGKPYDTFRSVTDAEGRTTLDDIRELPGLELKTEVTFEGASDRVTQAQTFQNGRLRVTRSFQPELRRTSDWLLPVAVVPQWGLASTQTFLVGDLLARSLATRFENGETALVQEWFEGTAIAKVSQVFDRQGRVKEHFTKTLNQGVEGGIPFDLTTRSRSNFWGTAAAAESEASVRGTDVSLFKDTEGDRTWFDLQKNFQAPLCTTDPRGEQGFGVAIRQSPKTNVLAVFNARLSEANSTTNPATLLLDVVDFHGLFFHKVTRQILDRAGNILEEQVGRIPNLGQTLYTEETIFQAEFQPTKRFHYRYEPGWLVESADPKSGARMMAFTNQQPAATAKSLRVNEDPWRDVVTEINGTQAAAEGRINSDNAQIYVFRRLHSRRELERNPFLPGHSDRWTAWTASELKSDGEKLFDSEMIYDGQGRLSLAKANKTTGSGKAANKIAYHLPAPSPGIWQEHALESGTQTVSLDAGRQKDFSGSDFVYFYMENASDGSVAITDAAGHTARVSRKAADFKKGEVSFWSIGSANVRWFPDEAMPDYGLSLSAPAALVHDGAVAAIAVPDLEQAGLDIRQLNSFTLTVTNETKTLLKISPLFQLVRGGEFHPDKSSQPRAFAEERHASGLKTTAIAQQQRTVHEIYTGQKVQAVAEFNGLPILIARPMGPRSGFPHVVVMDSSDTDSPRPLYAISPKDGRFLEYYKTVKLGHAQVYTVVQGFDLPRLEVFNAKVLEEEIAPGFIAYGDDYQVTIKYARARGLLGQTFASIHNRVVANGFKLGGERLLKFARMSRTSPELASHLDYRSLQNARNQAAEINQLPTLAQALLPARDLPWKEFAAPRSEVFVEDWDKVRFGLSKLHLDRATGLIPTAPETATERYVDTVQEADLIVLAIKLGEVAMAKELLDFFWEKSQGGQRALHASYDAAAGSSMAATVMFQRPYHAERTAEAQLAIADAAFQLGLETSDAKWLTLGRGLLHLALAEFRAPDISSQSPRGLSEFQFLPTRRAYGFTLWPQAEVYSLRCNSRAYLLLKQLNEIVGTYFADPAWKFQIAEALKEQEAWFKKYILPQVERTGVVPNGLFQIQDIHQETTALGVERATSAEDWLAFLEAAHAMGIPPATTQRWLENLARVHGVQVRGAWGLDWQIPMLRPDAISPELTARFARVAKLIGHAHAEQFAQQNVAALRNTNSFPTVVTEALPELALADAHGFNIHPNTNHLAWPNSFAVQKELSEQANPSWPLAKAAPKLETKPVDEAWPPQRTDRTVFIFITAGFYLSILLLALFWWRFRALRRHEHSKILPEPLVPDATLERAEERWAKHVLGIQTPADAEKTRFSNAPVEQNFLMQLRAIYKLVLEWRRQENGWDENDPRLADDVSDDWLNGLDEYASVMGIYMRWVIKAGAKDGFAKADPLADSEDSNHIWSRLVMYFSEYYWALLSLMRDYNNFVTPQDKAGMLSRMAQLFSTMGLRQRAESFDARELFDYPANRSAMDLLAIQKPGMTLDKLMIEASVKLRIPYVHLERVIAKYKEFKKREQPYPIHPYLIEFAKIMPHFLLMGLGALIWYNQSIGDSPIVPYLWTVLTKFALSPWSLTWALPLFASLVLGAAAHFVRIYRFEAPMMARAKAELFLDATLTSLFTKRHSIMPKVKEGRRWNPSHYLWASWALRTVGYLWLGITLLRLETPSFATFLVVKGLLAMLAFTEVAAIVLPLAGTAFSKFMQDWITAHPDAGKFLKFVNRLNITATKPASPFWLSIKYHAQPSVPTGSFWGMTQAIVFYFVLAAVFFFVGGYLCQQIFSLWFTDTYLAASDWKLILGGLLFWNTMYLLRYGLFLMFTGIASALVTFPVKGFFAILAVAQIVLVLFGPALHIELTAYPIVTYSLMLMAVGVMLFERQILNWFRQQSQSGSILKPDDAKEKLQQIKADRSATLGVVYMSGDDLSFLKLTPALLMERWTVLRDRLASDGLRMIFGMVHRPEDETLRSWFQALYDAEKQADVTVWHPTQICVTGETPRLRAELGLNIAVASAAQRQQLLTAWHLRRWLVSMMSTAGHSQDTAVNLVDIALRLDKEGLGANVVFYLIQNKYDASENNRPSQAAYDQGELGHRNKLARLLCEVAPGARAHNLQNWTPFGFKAGGLTGMDLVHEESLKLTTMLLLDRNATVHDLDALMKDLTIALTDPDVVIIIPGRSTTNTLTSVGQGSQMVEEGHRSFLKGLMALGGTASEAVGTGWGNLLAVFYGRVQRALVDAHSLKMPLTSRMHRGSTFAVRSEGLIGFAPHAVGISEDTWAVSQTAHNAIALGHRVKFLLSNAMWHKIRETWSHAEWLASFPRWSGGYLQMMHDPIMQRINDFGPKSVFAKEIRANSGRNFLSAPFALLNVMLMPLAIMLDVTPFIQILVVLWNFGFIMNQILTVHGLNTYLESSGFYRIPALLGAIIVGAFPFFKPGLQPFAPGLIALGFIGGGFFVGLSRWLYTRLRDMILFGPQLVLNALGQIVRQSLEFVVSGASPEDAKGVNMAFRTWVGPREDRPLDNFANFINLKTVIWGFGLLSVVLNLFALSNLDMLNVLLLLPSLLFSVSALAGPFLLKPRVGRPLGAWTFIPKLLGWLTVVVFYTIVSLLLAKGGAFDWAGIILFVGVFGVVALVAAKYAGYRLRLKKAQKDLVKLLAASASEEAGNFDKLASQLLALGSDTAKVQATLDRAEIPAAQHAPIHKRMQERIVPLLRAPVTGPQQGRFANSRWVSEFNRSFLLALLILLWFFIVPVPGRFVFTAGEYRISMALRSILHIVGWGLGLVIVGAWIGSFIQWADRQNSGVQGLRARLENAFQQFRLLVDSPGRLTAQEISSTYALFTDTQTYLDQRSYAYARRCLKQIEETLGTSVAGN